MISLSISSDFPPNTALPPLRRLLGGSATMIFSAAPPWMAQLLDFGAAWALPVPLPLRPPNMAQDGAGVDGTDGRWMKLLDVLLNSWDMVRANGSWRTWFL